MAVVLLQEPADGPRALPRARPLHPADQAQEHAALDDGGGADHPPRDRVLREGVTVAQIAVTAFGAAAIVWVLWYFLFSRGPAVVAREAGDVPGVGVTVKGGDTPPPIAGRGGEPGRGQLYCGE